MPKYTFECDKCDFNDIKTFSISDFLIYKEEKKECPECNAGVLSHKLGKIRNEVDKSSLEIMDDIRIDVQKTIKKIEAGDQRTIESIYGDKPNPYKE